LLLLALLLLTSLASAQETPEAKAFKDGARAFQDGIFERAERELDQFLATYPASTMLPEATLLRARAAIALDHPKQAVSLLNSNLAKAGPLADQYHYRIGEAQYASSNYVAAAGSFSALTRSFTNSGLLLEAAHFEALAWFKLRDFSLVVTLLQNADGPFQRAARARPTHPITARGRLLLAEALLEQRRLAEAGKAVLAIPETDLLPDMKWDRQYLLCRILLAEGRLPEALEGATNLVSLAIGAAKPELRADSTAFQAGLLRQLGQLDAALQVFTGNLGEAVPPDRRRLALLNIIELQMAQGRFPEATRLLEVFLTRHVTDTAADLVLFTLGEVNLRLYLAAARPEGNDAGPAPTVPAVVGSSTNHLQEALSQFEKILSAYSNSPVRAKAFLNKGWCLWLDDKPADSAVAFRVAVELLPFSEDAAVARFKLADAQLRLGDVTNALTNYRAVARSFSTLPRVQAELVPRAMFQIVSAATATGDLKASEEAMRRLLETQPDNPLTERSLLLLGESLTSAKQPARARQVYTEFAQRFPNSPLLPEVQLARGRTYFDAGDWPAAVQEEELWLQKFPTNELRPQVEFALAWSHAKAGDETNALNLFTNFLAQFPTNELAPRAKFWVGDYYMGLGDYVGAQSAYQEIVENPDWPVTLLTYQARLAAGRAAFKRQGWKDAETHFTSLVNDLAHCPPSIAAEAMFALGDTKTKQTEPGGPQDRIAEAKKVFQKIPDHFGTNELVRDLVLLPAAWGRIGDCSLQLASQEPAQYERATNAYWQVLTNKAADAELRSKALFAIGRAFELQAAGLPASEATNLLSAAFEHYYDVVIGAGPLAQTGTDPLSLKEAGLAAARIAEERRQWKRAISIYERMAPAVPTLKRRLQDKIDKAREQLRLEGVD
jgi:TolA-binding protein